MSQTAQEVKPKQSLSFDVIVIGAGFAGLAALRTLRDELGCSVRLLEAAPGAGGVWYWNRYPGARCDVESLQYSYAFSREVEQEWNWTERFASQPEILRYIDHVVERFKLAKDIRFDTRVAAVTWDETRARWSVETANGDRYDCRFCVMATGPLSTINIPAFPGKDEFRGESYHTGVWPQRAVELEGKRVAIIGTGSSGVQAAPMIAKQAAQLYVMQRTAHHAVPAANRPLHPGEQDAVKAQYPALRAAWQQTPGAMSFRSLPTPDPIVPGDKSALEVSEDERRATFENAWRYGGTCFHRSFNDLLMSEAASQLANDFLRAKIASIVSDPKVADLLTPRQYYGTKRLILEIGYYEMFNRPNVTLVDVKSDPIERLTPTGIKTRNAHYEVDTVVFATGYDALTGSLTRMDVRGRGGKLLRDAWRDGPRSYLGLMVAGFPNLFIIAGPQSPSVLVNVVAGNEHQVGWIAGCIRDMEKRGAATIEPTAEAQSAWVEHVNEVGAASIYTKGDNWYIGANIPGKPRVFLPYIGFPRYAQKCAEVVSNGYEGFALAQGSARSD